MVSKGEINRNGDRLRDWMMNIDDYNDVDQEIVTAWATVQDFRSGFQRPLIKATNSIRGFVARESNEVIVAQRLKRMPQIINKLVRFPETKLARMEDIAGCRAILRSRREIDGVVRRVSRNWDVVRLRDYIATPKDSGYRGVHVVVERDGTRVEVQLRTPGQQSWADAVEGTAGRLSMPLKDGQGDERLLGYFRMAAEGIAAGEEGLAVDERFMTEFRDARTDVQHFFQRGRS